MTTEKKTEFLRKVDICCGECGYDAKQEDPCAGCPVRKTCDNLDADTREEIRLEHGTFQADYCLDDGSVAIKEGETVTIIDAFPDEDDAGYCDVIDAHGKTVLQATWMDLEGLYQRS